MSVVDTQWVQEQFIQARVKKGIGLAVLDMLKAWEPVDLKPDDAKVALEILSKVALGHALVTTPPTELWVQAQPGQLNVGDAVRIRHDAFNGAEGVGINGRSGIIAAIRSGDIIFNTTDQKSPSIEGAHYRPAQMEKRIR
jgi:hypothetical protein